MSESAFWNETNIALLPEEEILYTLEPDRAAMFKSSMLGSILVSIFFGPFIILLLPLFWWANKAHVRRHQGFVPNQRVIVTNGLIGYNTRSVPLERISDVQIGCSWVERYFNIRSLIVRDMTGEAQGGARMLGIREVMAVQELILCEVRRVNVLASEPRAAIQPKPAPAAESSEMIHILKEIRDALVQR